MKEKGKIRKKDSPTRWDSSKYYPTKAELEQDLRIPGATPEKLAKAVANYHLYKRR